MGLLYFTTSISVEFDDDDNDDDTSTSGTVRNRLLRCSRCGLVGLY